MEKISQSEFNILKAFFRKFDLEKHELDELKPYLLSPTLAKQEKDELYRQMIAELSSPRGEERNYGCVGESMVRGS